MRQFSGVRLKNKSMQFRSVIKPCAVLKREHRATVVIRLLMQEKLLLSAVSIYAKKTTKTQFRFSNLQTDSRRGCTAKQPRKVTKRSLKNFTFYRNSRLTSIQQTRRSTTSYMEGILHNTVHFVDMTSDILVMKIIIVTVIILVLGVIVFTVI